MTTPSAPSNGLIARPPLLSQEGTTLIQNCYQLDEPVQRRRRIRIMKPQDRRGFLQTSGAALAAAFVPPLGAVQTSKRSEDDLTRLTLSDASDLLRAHKVTSVDLTSACLTRIARLNPELNAFITVTADRAMADARSADSDIANGRWRGPLHGIPIGLKDLFDTAGVRTTAGSALFADRVPSEDAEVVRRLKAAGAVIVGKLNMHEFAYGDTSAQSYFGPVRNPWNRNLVAGGSSGGSAAAVAAGLCYGALGSDTGGSIRQPSAYCGIVGLKPTHGLVSTRGVIPLSWSLDHVGPMCRRVTDAALMLQSIAGYDALDINSINAAPQDYVKGMARKVSSLRIGIPRATFYDSLDSDIEQAVSEALRILRDLNRVDARCRAPGLQNATRRWRRSVHISCSIFHKDTPAIPTDDEAPARRRRSCYSGRLHRRPPRAQSVATRGERRFFHSRCARDTDNPSTAAHRRGGRRRSWHASSGRCGAIASQHATVRHLRSAEHLHSRRLQPRRVANRSRNQRAAAG